MPRQIEDKEPANTGRTFAKCGWYFYQGFKAI
jgi:hypothetical protein